MVTAAISSDNFGEDQRDHFAESAHRRGLEINFERVRATLIRNARLILVIIAVFLLAALGLTALMRPQYTAVASVQIEQQAAKVVGSEDADPVAAYQDADRFLQTQVDILKSRSLAERVMDVLHLDRDQSFIRVMGASPDELQPSPKPQTVRREQIIALLMDKLKVELPRTSRVASVSFVSPSAQVATTVANTFANQFIFANLQRRFDATSYARKFVADRLDDVRRRLENSERQVNVYSRNAGLIDASNAAVSSTANGSAGTGTAPRSLTLARLVQLNSALVTAQTERTEAEERWNVARRTPLMSLPEVLSNSAIQELRQQQAQLAAAYEEEKQRHREVFPSMVQQAARIAELDSQISRMAMDVRRAISDTYQASHQQEREIAGDIATLEGVARDEQDRGVRYNILRREVDTNRELYDGLLQRFKQLSAEAGATTNNVSIVDRAEVPRRPTSPKLLLNLLLALVLGILAAAAIVILRELFDDRIRLPEDVPVKLGLPLLGSIPKLATGESPRDVLEVAKSDLAEAYQAMRATLELSTNHGTPKSLLLTSSRPSEGKSTSAYALARTFARQGRKVILVDADLRRPSLHRLLQLDNDAGLSNLLSGQQSIDEVLRSSESPNLSMITSGPIPPDPAQLFDRDVMRSVFGTLESRCDLLIVDAPPVLGLADTLELASVVKGVLFVVESGSMHFGGVRSSIKRLRDVQANLLGVLLNKFDAKAVGYSASYSYSYTYSYGSST